MMVKKPNMVKNAELYPPYNAYNDYVIYPWLMYNDTISPI